MPTLRPCLSQARATRQARHATPVSVSLFLLLVVGAARAQNSSVFSVTLKPLTDDHHAVEAIEVTETLEEASSVKGQLKLAAPITSVGVTHIADRVTDLRVEDQEGPVSLTTSDDAANVMFTTATGKRCVRSRFPSRSSTRPLSSQMLRWAVDLPSD